MGGRDGGMLIWGGGGRSKSEMLEEEDIVQTRKL